LRESEREGGERDAKGKRDELGFLVLQPQRGIEKRSEENLLLSTSEA